MKRIVGAGGGGGGCFLGHTLVRTPDGLRAIEALQPGDLVVSFDDQGELHHAKVLKVHVHEGERVVRYRLWGGAVLDATPNHWVLNQFNAFVEIGTLGSDDCLVDENGHLRPIVDREDHGRGTVYNLTVEGHHTFIAGGIRVHNAGLGLGITGAGGGGGGGKGGGGSTTPYTPTEAADNLASTAYVNIVDVLGEGEIQGFATPERANTSKSSAAYNVELLKDVFVNNTPVLRSAAVVKTGTYSQTATTITVTCTAHGYTVNSKVVLSIDTGLAGSGTYKITAATANTFTAAGKNENVTSGNLAISRPADYNFKNFSLYTRYGTADQTPVKGFDRIESEHPVGSVVEFDTPIVRTITNPNVDAVRVSVTVPALQQFQSNGDITGASVALRIDLSEDGGGYYTAIYNTIRGRTADQYQRDYEVSLAGKSFPVDVKVVRVTADSTSAKLQNAFSWTSYTEIVDGRLTYPNTALVATRIAAEQFNSIPTRAFKIRGRKVAIPSNATVDRATGALIYTGVWDGTFGAAAWTSDPAWCLWDLLTDYRVGFGDHLNASQLDKWAFYSASRYCSALNTRPNGTTDDYNAITGRHGISDGFNGFEPRFSCNVNIQTQEDAYKLINDLCSVFRVMPYWATGALTISQDAPADPSYLFTLANVSEEGFSYSASSQKTKPSAVLVNYLDMETRDTAYEQVEDQDAIKRFGIVTQEISAFACTSRGQARRLGEWFLYSNNYEGEVVAFTASIDAGVVVRPGQIISIADPMKAGARRGGRIKEATTTTVTVDDGTNLTGSGSTLSVILPTGAVETRSVSSRSENVITVAPAFSAAPNANSIWVYENSGIQTSTWRVISVTEQDQCQYAINAVSYNSSKYGYIEREQELQVRDISDLNEPPDTPTDLTTTEALYTYQAEVRAKVIVSWNGVSNAASYLVRWRKDSGNWEEVDTLAPDYEILNITPGTFDLEIYAVSGAGKLSNDALTGSVTALGKTAPPSNVPTFSAVLDRDIGVTLTWDPVTDLDLQGYEIWEGIAFGNGTKLGVFAATAKKVGLMPTGTITWHIKALDTSGVYSADAASTTLTINAAPAPSTGGSFAGENLILTWSAVAGDLATDYYELRYGAVSDTWATATTLATTKSTAYAVKAQWSGTRRFFVAAVDLKGNVGAANYYDAIVTAPSQPTVTQEVIDNNVLLKWNDCTATIPLDSYELRRGSTWAGGTVIGTKKGLFTTVFETASGTYTYWLAGIDLAGNYGTPGSVAAVVNQPPDYVLKFNQDSTFNGTVTNMLPLGSGLLASVDSTETWQSHFTSRGWSTPQDQIDAGYTYFSMPSTTTAQYYEDIDYGTVLAGTKVTATLTSNAVAGSTTITPTIKVKKLSGDPWTTYAGVSSVFATDFRYIRVQYDFSSAGGNDLLDVTALNVRLDSKQQTDAGTGTANSSDTGGTVVNFNIGFVDVDSISVTPTTTSPVIAVYDFVDAPYPTSFKVLLFNTSGTRVSGGFSWIARGV